MIPVRPDRAALAELAGLVDAGAVRLRIDSAFPLSGVRIAHERFAKGGLNGKVVLMF